MSQVDSRLKLSDFILILMGEQLGIQIVKVRAPEPGQLVEVRRRQWVVSDVQGQSFDNMS